MQLVWHIRPVLPNIPSRYLNSFFTQQDMKKNKKGALSRSQDALFSISMEGLKHRQHVCENCVLAVIPKAMQAKMLAPCPAPKTN
ncbi:hypothetical protein KM92DES2_12768 [uncultured Desulfovibrio sp.]|uniref:Uncharacterized protein n=2 Tax=root TaxID=1 RepID=A0A212KDI3_9BACT|nr:hypothetical protein KM92DES2_12768 [uncultured Desulfovibrio sp.]